MKTNEKWICVASQEGIPLREGRRVDLGAHQIAVFNLGDRILAVENRCPHRGGPLSDGIIAGGSVVCPLHSWKVCLSTGSVVKPPEAACVSTYQARLKAGHIYLALPESGGKPNESHDEIPMRIPPPVEEWTQVKL